MKGAVITIYQDHSYNLVHYYLKVKDTLEIEDIHKLRVSIKGIKILLSIVEKASKGRFRKDEHFQLLKGVFKAAGKVREEQVNLQILDQMDGKSFNCFHKHFLQNQRKFKKPLRKELKKFCLRKFFKLNQQFIGAANKLSKKQTKRAIINYITDKSIKIQKSRIKEKGDKDLHQIRIEFKRIEEGLKLLRRLNKTTKSKELTKSVKHIRCKIGEWHDNKAFIKSFKKLQIKKRNNKESREKDRVLQVIKSENNQLRKKIQSLVTHFNFKKIHRLC